jgi:hypothetical protein
MISIKQKSGIDFGIYAGFYGGGTVNPVELTPFEVEQLIKELTQAVNQARNQSKYLRKR